MIFSASELTYSVHSLYAAKFCIELLDQLFILHLFIGRVGDRTLNLVKFRIKYIYFLHFLLVNELEQISILFNVQDIAPPVHHGTLLKDFLCINRSITHIVNL